jgi:hypothetical protein
MAQRIAWIICGALLATAVRIIWPELKRAWRKV